MSKAGSKIISAFLLLFLLCGTFTIFSASLAQEVKAAATYTIRYNTNGGTGYFPIQTKEYGKPILLSSARPTRTGYTFQGWALSATATYATYSAGAYYTANANVTLFAVWKPITYTIKYNPNGGTGYFPDQSKEHGKSVSLSSARPTRTGYTFQGWATASTSTYVSYSAGAIYTANANMTLYAVWKPVTYTVKYDVNGGTGYILDQTKEHGKTLTLSFTKPTRSGYVFQGWSTIRNGSVTYGSGAPYIRDSDITLYAAWK